ncbi:MAG: hypothetical protein HYS81_03480 [Candidatus Aenigmatarchaeota archaeon]|nr:MAG: hypothetical protein HYS81_03480 [Candidatus Aenigmarchaeota archaeon]
MSKGISDIVSNVLIVLVVIALASAFLLWGTGTLTQTQQTGTQNVQTYGASTQKAVSIDALACSANSLTIRNTGSVSFAVTDVTVYVNEVAVTPTGAGWTGTVAVGATKTGTVTLASGDAVRVTVAGAAVGASSRCA